MTLTLNSFCHMIKSFRLLYGPNWRPDLIETNQEALFAFFYNCQELIPEELVDEVIATYRVHRGIGPQSPYNIFSTYLEKRLEDAKSSEFIIDRIVTAIKKYEYSDNTSMFASRDDYLFSNVISVLPCSVGVKEFYIRNKRALEQLALYSPDQYEQASIYNRLGKDYDKQLIIAAREDITKSIDYTTLGGGTMNYIKLEA